MRPRSPPRAQAEPRAPSRLPTAVADVRPTQPPFLCDRLLRSLPGAPSSPGRASSSGWRSRARYSQTERRRSPPTSTACLAPQGSRPPAQMCHVRARRRPPTASASGYYASTHNRRLNPPVRSEAFSRARACALVRPPAGRRCEPVDSAQSAVKKPHILTKRPCPADRASALAARTTDGSCSQFGSCYRGLPDSAVLALAEAAS